MRKAIIGFCITAVALLMLSSCSAKLGELAADNFKVNPNPLETHGGQVQATINGAFPEGYMKRNAVVMVTPELRYMADGMQQKVQGESATFQGEEVMGNDQIISYMLGGHYTMRSSFPYVPAMEQSELWMSFNARVGNKVVTVPAVKIADGVIATSELYKRTLTSAKPVVAEDAFQRVTEERLEANIRFLVAQTELRKSELQNNSVTEFVKLLQRVNQDREMLNINNIDISAYASPEGSLDINERLASGRQKVTTDYVRRQLDENQLQAYVDTHYTAEDWEGFQQLVRASVIQDKDVILRVLSMYQDPEEREKQIRNMSEAFRELADGILPELRRARLTVNYEIIGRDDAQIKEQLKNNVSKLSVEELLYAATLTDNAGEQLNIYQQTTRLFPQDARAYNNIGNVYFAQGDYEEAGRYYQRALSIDRNCGAAHANIGLLELINGNTAEAENSIGRASTVRRLGETLGNLHLAQGNYALAEQDFGYTASNSAALAEIMNKNYERAAQTLDNIKQADAMTDYLRAILNARQGNNEAAATSLGKAVTKDASLKPLADRDLEMKAVSK